MRHLGPFIVLTGLLAGSAVPAQADAPTGGINQCLVLAVCLEISQPGSGGAPGSGGNTGSGNGGGEPVCVWKGLQKPCWDPDLGWFDNSDDGNQGCYFKALDPSDPALKDQTPEPGKTPYLQSCWDANGNLQDSVISWFAQAPSAAAPPPTPGTVAQMAIGKLQFVRPVIHTAPTGKSLVTVPVFLWYDHGTAAAPDPETIGPQSRTVSLNGVSVTATATLTDVSWDMGYQADGKEAVADCHGPGVPYVDGMENNPPAGACYWRFGSLSPANGAPPSGAPAPTASAAPGGGYWPLATETWHVTTVNNNDPNGPAPWDPLDLQVSSLPVQLQVNQLQMLN
ncbi:hypothetical protein LN042_00410 [Kitasatospora sp. RB6PN24]|uniref:hypothetical protein n=1 Tax=Kitasatospora humi TaxID=2893891 RepID=UPI001E3F0374|nr:hypothetical protein [Kitasatospora humi]MCC9305591.1 hypothetical protein [Kitasatospora humi]